MLTLLQESLKMLSFSIWAVAIHANDHALVINEVHHMKDQSCYRLLVIFRLKTETLA